MTESADVSIVIVSYNVKDLLLKCLETLFAYNSSVRMQVIVVDNHSSDNSVEAVQTAYPQVELIANSTNTGFPAANNQAFEKARGEYLLMLNPDTEFISDAVVQMVQYCRTHADVQLLGPRLLNTDGTLQKSAWRFPTVWSVFCELHYLHFLDGKHYYADADWSREFEADSFSGAAIFFHRSVLEKAGKLDETMFWIEDVEFCLRAKKAGFTMRYVPSIGLIHHIGQSAKKNYNVSLSNQVFNKIKYFRKHKSRLAAAWVTWMSFVHCCWKLVLFVLLSPFKTMWRRKAKAYAYTLPKVFNPPKGMT